MAEPTCGIPEERWVDWVAGRLPADAYDAMSRHLARCEACRAVREEWEKLFAVAEAGEQPTHERAASEKSRMLLRRRVRRIGIRRRVSRIGSKRNLWTIAACAAILLLAVRGMAGMLAHEDASPMEEAQAYAEKYEPSGAVLMAQPDTVAYTLDDLYRTRVGELTGRPTATVWVNGSTQEMFMLLEGLLPSDDLDVQAWGNLEDRLTNLGLLEFHSRQGHLYSHVEHLSSFKEVVFTIEPKGGSDRPTAPTSAVVRLAAEAQR